MKTKNALKANLILLVYLVATTMLLLWGYSVQKPEVERCEFPFTITYSYQGRTETISDVFVGEYMLKAKYIDQNPVTWYGYIKDHNMLESSFYRVVELESQTVFINVNLIAGYLMGDPRNAGSVCQPTAEYRSFDGVAETVVTKPAELEQLGFSLVSWEYPASIENTFAFGGISLSSEATMYTAAIAIAALLACMILIKKDKDTMYGKIDKVSIVLNFLIAFVAFPFIFMVSALSEILADTSFWQQILYLTPALTLLGVAASVSMRRCGYGKWSIIVQLAGPVVFVFSLFIEGI